MFFKNKNETSIFGSAVYPIENKNTKQREDMEEEIKEPEEEWMWVEGYKGTNKDMICRDMEYKLNCQFTYYGDIDLCGAGFHFCKNIKDVFSYYPLNFQNRFFKVKCLVNKKNWGTNDSKFVAKEIFFIEELGYKELENFIVTEYKFVKDENDWNCIMANGIEGFYKKYFISNMLEYGYVESFACVLYERLNKKRLETDYQNKKDYSDIQRSYKYVYNLGGSQFLSNSFYQEYQYKFDTREYDSTLEKVKAFKEEGLSKDMSVYLLLTQ